MCWEAGSISSSLLPSIPGVYCSGWVKTGPIGVIVSTMNGSFETGANLLDDLANGVVDANSPKPGSDFIVDNVLKSKGG